MQKENVYTLQVLEGKRCIRLKLLQMTKNAFSSNFRSQKAYTAQVSLQNKLYSIQLKSLHKEQGLFAQLSGLRRKQILQLKLHKANAIAQIQVSSEKIVRFKFQK